MATQNVNLARFARNIKWDFFYDFQTLWCCVPRFFVIIIVSTEFMVLLEGKVVHIFFYNWERKKLKILLSFSANKSWKERLKKNALFIMCTFYEGIICCANSKMHWLKVNSLTFVAKDNEVMHLEHYYYALFVLST